MRRAHWWNPRLGPLGLCAVLWLMHAALLQLLSRTDVVSSIFAAGEQTPRWMLGCAGVFVVIRLSVFLMTPAILAGWAAASVVGRLRAVRVGIAPHMQR